LRAISRASVRELAECGCETGALVVGVPVLLKWKFALNWARNSSFGFCEFVLSCSRSAGHSPTLRSDPIANVPISFSLHEETWEEGTEHVD
jgi:hypothetical protein